VPARTCVACRKRRDKASLLRVVRGPDGDVTVDATGQRPGRGAYLCADAACWSLSLRRGSLQRALGRELPPTIRMRLEEGPDSAQAHTPTLQGGAHGA
jgi:uncharacterized protein